MSDSDHPPAPDRLSVPERDGDSVYADRRATSVSRRTGGGPGGGVGDPAEPGAAPVLGLLVPADPGAAVVIVLVRPSAAAFSDLIGGGLLDDALEGASEGGGFAVYLDLEREAKGLPANERAAALLGRLAGLAPAGGPQAAEVRGDALIVGVDVRGGDGDVPVGVLVEACLVGQRVAVGVSC